MALPGLERLRCNGKGALQNLGVTVDAVLLLRDGGQSGAFVASVALKLRHQVAARCCIGALRPDRGLGEQQSDSHPKQGGPRRRDGA